jgi:hypothetical protein
MQKFLVLQMSHRLVPIPGMMESVLSKAMAQAALQAQNLMLRYLQTVITM